MTINKVQFWGENWKIIYLKFSDKELPHRTGSFNLWAVNLFACVGLFVGMCVCPLARRGRGACALSCKGGWDGLVGLLPSINLAIFFIELYLLYFSKQAFWHVPTADDGDVEISTNHNWDDSNEPKRHQPTIFYQRVPLSTSIIKCSLSP